MFNQFRFIYGPLDALLKYPKFYALTDSQVTATEFEKINEQVETAFERDDTFFSSIEKAKDFEISGRDGRLPLKIRPGGKFGHYNPEGGSLGLGEGVTTEKGLVNIVDLKFAVQLNRKPVMATDNKRKAVLDAFKTNMADAMPEFRTQVDRLCMTGGNGVLATVTSVGSGTGVGGSDRYTLSSTDGFGARLLRFGQDINVYDTTLATNRTAAGERAILGIDYASKTIDIAAVSGGTGTDKIVISGVSGASPVSLLGVPYHHNAASSGTWLGLNRANFPEIRANQVNASSAGFALPFARLMVNKIGDRVGLENSYKPVLWMHPCQAQAVEELAQLVQTIDRSNAQGEAKINLYFKQGPTLAGCSSMLSFNWDKTRIDAIEKSLWARVQIKEPGIYESGGRRIFELRASTGAVMASDLFYITAGINLGHRNPAVGSYISGLAIPSGY